MPESDRRSIAAAARLTLALQNLNLDAEAANNTIDKAEAIIVNTEEAVCDMIKALDNSPKGIPSLYVDLEGENLGRLGNVAIMQIYFLPSSTAYLVDIHTLQQKAFHTAVDNGNTLKDMLESKSIVKVFFDVRNDSDALYSHYGIHLQGVQDLQLMELATRGFSRKHINGLSKCIERDAKLSMQERKSLMRVKEQGVRLFAPEKGGSYSVFSKRPLDPCIKDYCTQDVVILPRLWKIYNSKLTPIWRDRVAMATLERVRLAKESTFCGKGSHMALAPDGWQFL